MQLRFLAAGLIFIGSYLPLSLILLAQDYKFEYLGTGVCINFRPTMPKCVLPFENPWLSITIFVMCFACFVITLFILKATRTKRSIIIHGAKHVPTELMSYTLPYVVSFMGVGYHEEGKFLGILIFLAWIFWITHKSGQVILNPILVVFGWKLYDINYSFSKKSIKLTSLALSKVDIAEGDVVAHNMIQDVMLIRSLNQNGEGE